jgi:bacillithiol system protein YtxJ
MAELRQCKSIDDVANMLNESKEKMTLLFKHSTICPISANAYSQFSQFIQNSTNDISAYIILVREDRPVSLHIAEISGVTHQSPQAIFFKNGIAVWDASHYSITTAKLQKALEECADK